MADIDPEQRRCVLSGSQGIRFSGSASVAGSSTSADPLSEPTRPKDADETRGSHVGDRVQVAGDDAASDQTPDSGHVAVAL